MKQPERKGSPFAILVVILFFVAPPLGFVAAIALAVYGQSKKTATARSEQPQAQVKPLFTKRTHTPETGRPHVIHVHTPQAYSYDGCAREKRLEQLETLKKAGLLEPVEYQQRRQAILGRP